MRASTCPASVARRVCACLCKLSYISLAVNSWPIRLQRAQRRIRYTASFTHPAWREDVTETIDCASECLESSAIATLAGKREHILHHPLWLVLEAVEAALPHRLRVTKGLADGLLLRGGGTLVKTDSLLGSSACNASEHRLRKSFVLPWSPTPGIEPSLAI